MNLNNVENKALNSGRSVNPTVRDLIMRALWRTNVVSIRETPEDNEVRTCLYELNAMIQHWFFTNVILSNPEYDLNDTLSLDIGASNPVYYDDCVVDNLSIRIIELYNLDIRAFPNIYKRAKETLNTLASMRRELQHDNGTFKSDFDATLTNTPDNALYSIRS